MKLSIPALLGKIAGGALVGLAPILGSLFPKQATLFTGVFGSGGMAIIIASMVVQSKQPSESVVENADIVSATTGKSTGATNISSTTDLFQKKGT